MKFLLSLCAILAFAASDSPLAFPGAEGFGAHAQGGRGGRTIEVTNLNDSGPGSFRAACDAKGPRIVVFRVAGLIDLQTPVDITEPYLTIAGQTAPGDGICLKRSEFQVRTHDVIVRYLRSRPGDIAGKEYDAMGIGGDAHDVIFDHCSANWSVDESLSPSGGISNITVQWCLIGEALNKSVHSKGPHGYGSLVRAVGGVTLHHNLWVHNDARNPRLGDNYGRGAAPTFDVRNNVMYDWGKTCSGLTGDDLSSNYVANYLRPGPSSSSQPPITLTPTAHVRYYVADNVVEGRPQFKDPASMFTPPNQKLFTIVDKPFDAPAVKTTSAEQALKDVLAHVGAVCPARDSVDARLMHEVETRTGKIINSQNEVGGWPVYSAGAKGTPECKSIPLQ
jgi:pectate lyase